MKQFRNLVLAVALTSALTGCSVFERMVYKIDIPQGNFIEQVQVEKLRIGMSKEQVEYILGRPVLQDSFAGDTWNYVYQFKNGRSNELTRKVLSIRFEQDQIIKATGDYELSEDFMIPLAR